MAAVRGAPPRARRSLFANLGAVLLAEGMFRLVSGERLELTGMYTAVPQAGVGLTPGFRGAMRTSEFDYDIAINDLGMRDGPVGPKRAGTQRILVIGDSFVFGYGVALADSMPKALERRLRALEPMQPVEVLSAGVPGYSPYQELYTLERLAPQVQPDLVVQVVFTGDDWYGNAPRKPPEEEQAGFAAQLRLHSSLYRFLDRFVLSRLKSGDHYEPHRIHPTPEFVARMDNVQGLLVQTQAFAREQGAGFLVALCPRYTQVYDDAWAKASLVYRLSADDYSPLEPNRTFGERLRAAGFRVVDLLEPLREEGRRRALHFPVDGHWNRDGNEFVASVLAGAIRAPQPEPARAAGG
jgi:hypothetical protein